MTVSRRPWIQAACVCEKVLVEQDRVPSLIRIVDTYTMILPDPVPDNAVPSVDLVAFVSLKSGDVAGNFDVGLRLVDPNGKASKVRKWAVELRGNEHGANLKLDFNLVNPLVGLYWFDVLWIDDELLTRIPFRLKKPTAQTSSDERAESTESK